MNLSRHATTIRGHCGPLHPKATGVETRLRQLAGIRAVMFDIYGTLLISASGDVGSDSAQHKRDSLEATIDLLGVTLTCSVEDAVQSLDRAVRDDHQRSREEGIAFPEVDIVEIWRSTLKAVASTPLDDIDLERFAVEFEVRVNPTWPMPGLETTLNAIQQMDLKMGIVSNAQFFTPLLFPALLGRSLIDLGFDDELTYFSYSHRNAKPGEYLYRLAQRQLESFEILPANVLYVGNDMLNDVAAAHQVGFRTALFAGDERSLRWRREDERVTGIQPDLVINELRQLTECLEGE